MNSISIKSKDILKIIDCNDETDIYGSNQDWYREKRKQRCGCGPATVTNIIYYIQNKYYGYGSNIAFTKEKCLELMDEVWNFVTPGRNGIPSTSMLGEGINKYLKEYKLNISLDYLDIPKKKELRPGIDKVIDFLYKAFDNDTPVAFLNLDNGEVKELEAYHWVTAISLEYCLNENTAFLNIIDGGNEIKIDLYRWLNTTKSGGGFVSFYIIK